MHHVFDIAELVVNILSSDDLRAKDRLHFGLTCKALWEVALPEIWKNATIKLETLCTLIPEGGIFERMDCMKGLEPASSSRVQRSSSSQLTPLKRYDHHITSIEFAIPFDLRNDPDLETYEELLNRADDLFLFSEDERSALFPCLQQVIMDIPAALVSRSIFGFFLRSSLVELDITLAEVDDLDYGITLGPSYVAGAISQLASGMSACGRLEQLSVQCRDREFSSELVSQSADIFSNLQKLRRLRVFLNPFVSIHDIYVCVARLPHLSVFAVHVPSPLWSDSLTDIPHNTIFQTINTLEMLVSFQSALRPVAAEYGRLAPRISRLKVILEVPEDWLQVLQSLSQQWGSALKSLEFIQPLCHSVALRPSPNLFVRFDKLAFLALDFSIDAPLTMQDVAMIASGCAALEGLSITKSSSYCLDPSNQVLNVTIADLATTFSACTGLRLLRLPVNLLPPYFADEGEVNPHTKLCHGDSDSPPDLDGPTKPEKILPYLSHLSVCHAIGGQARFLSLACPSLIHVYEACSDPRRAEIIREGFETFQMRYTNEKRQYRHEVYDLSDGNRGKEFQRVFEQMRENVAPTVSWRTGSIYW